MSPGFGSPSRQRDHTVGCKIFEAGNNRSKVDESAIRNDTVVLIESQNDFTSTGGVFLTASRVMQSNNMLANTVEFVNKSREAGVTIMHAPITFAEGYGELTGNPYGILKAVVDNRAFRKGSWGAAIVDVLKPHSGYPDEATGLVAFPSPPAIAFLGAWRPTRRPAAPRPLVDSSRPAAP